MKFRPCIDIHNGSVKQIVGGSLKDEGDLAQENFVAAQDAAFFSKFYREHGLSGGHVILLNPAASPHYEETKKQALAALLAYPGGLQAGGGITPENAADFLEAGASHVIVTSYVFSGGEIRYDRLRALLRETGKDKLTLDLSVRGREGRYYIVTDRWQKYTSVELTYQTFRLKSAFNNCVAYTSFHGRHISVARNNHNTGKHKADSKSDDCPQNTICLARLLKKSFTKHIFSPFFLSKPL